MVIGLFGPPHVVPLHLFLGRHHVDAIEERNLVRRAKRPAFRTRAVVTIDIDDKRIVALAQLVDGLDDATDLVIVVGSIGRKDFDLPDEELLLDIGELIPMLQLVFGPRR